MAALLVGCSAGPPLAGPPPAPSATTPAPAPTGVAGAKRGDRPNIVFVLTDDLSNNLVPYMPHVQALQRAGMSFTNYTVTDSLCCPSRASIFSGRYPHNTGVFTNEPPDGGWDVFHARGEEASTFATSLQKAGYRTGFMGKYMNRYPARGFPGSGGPYVPPGWSEWNGSDNGYDGFNYDLNENGRLVHYGHAPADYLTDVVGGKATAFIRSASAAHSPFMLEVATFAPHFPYTPAPRDREAFPGLTAPRGPAFDTLPATPPSWLAPHKPLNPRQVDKINAGFRKRVQSVQAVDRMIAAIQDTLAATGEAGNTVLVFNSDNGFHMGEYRLTPDKLTAFDTDVLVPLVVAGPGIAANSTTPAIAQNIDLRPTFEDLTGATTPAEVDGRSLVPLLHGQTPPDWPTTALVEHHGPVLNPADPDRPGRYGGNPPSYEALRTAGYTYVEYGGGEREFYDRDRDPAQLNNIAATLPAETATRLHDSLDQMRNCHGQAACSAAAHSP
ncbi:MAG: sulfatase [Pseudonocardia sp.]|nr:sulfatase [Pseudonocardia sp.]MBO0877363.1 sulfatase [Pseudonocardia sp.]